MDQTDAVRGDVLLRDVKEDDLPIFFEQQRDPFATAIADFPARERDAFMAHWRKILGDDTVVTRTVLYDGQVAGNVVSFVEGDQQEVGYWLGRSYWSRGVATGALSAFLDLVTTQPLHAHVARHNAASLRVLEKCGFTVIGCDKASAGDGGEDSGEVSLRLD
jgi:RimJ/RimL family protein N-acetyltransferase